MIYFAADTHFGHANIIRFCNRPFGTVEEMDEALVDNWNGTVGDRDTVYFLGDLFFRASPDRVRGILCRLKGQKHLVIGNHDSSWMTKELVNSHFVEASHFLQVSVEGRHLVMCHYPLLCWGGEGKSWMIHGHIHNNRHMDYWPLLQIRERVLNAGVEINGYAPVPFEKLLENNARQKELPREEKSPDPIAGQNP
jgi:calcineurin-like phosphoesterase family protein